LNSYGFACFSNCTLRNNDDDDDDNDDDGHNNNNNNNGEFILAFGPTD